MALNVFGKVLMFGFDYEGWVAGLRWGARGPLKGFVLTVNPLHDGLTAGIEVSKIGRLRFSLR